MKKLMSISAVLILSTIAFAQFEPGDIGFDQNKTALLYKTNKIKTQTKLLLDTVYNTEEPVEVNTYTEEGWLLHKIYPGDIIYGDADDSIGIYSDEFTYFPDGRIRIITYTGYDLYPIQIGFEYTKKGKLDSCIIASAEARHYGYTYDKKGNIVHAVGMGYVFAYDDNGNFMDEMQLVEMETMDYTWNEKNQLIKEVTKLRGEYSSSIEYTYDEAGNLKSKLLFVDTSSGAQPVDKYFYFYDDKGLLIRLESHEWEENLTYRFEYTYY